MNFKELVWGLCFVLGTAGVSYAQSSQIDEAAATRVVQSYYENWKFNLWNIMIEVFADTSVTAKTEAMAAYSKEKTQLMTYTLTKVRKYKNPERIVASVKLKLKQNSVEKEVSDSVTLIQVGATWKFKEQPTYHPGKRLARKKQD